MATPADYLSVADLKNIAANGFVNEDVIQKIADASTGVKPVLLDMIGRSPVKNSYSEWTEDQLDAVDLTNAVLDGYDAQNPAQTMSNAARVGNHAQTSVKEVSATERAQNVSTIGQSDILAYRTARKIMELRRDIEAIMLSNQASVADDGSSTPGKSAGLGAWLSTHTLHGSGGSAGGFNNSTKVVDAPVVGNARTITLANIRTMIGDLYDEGVGENGLVCMGTPKVIKAVSEKIRTDSTGNFVSPVANITGSGSGVMQTGQGWTNSFVTDFGITVRLVANRLQQTYSSADSPVEDVSALYIFDPQYLAYGTLHDVKVEQLAKNGLSHRRLISTDWMLKVLLERACGAIFDIDEAAPL